MENWGMEGSLLSSIEIVAMLIILSEGRSASGAISDAGYRLCCTDLRAFAPL